MTLLGLKGTEDELSSPDVRNLSHYVDRLGTQMLLSSPRDIHLVMAFELLLAHEPGLVGTSASQFEPEGRGFGLASENLLTCSIKVAKELRLERSITEPRSSSTRLSRLSLWCCLRSWEALYAFFGPTVNALDDLDTQYAIDIKYIMSRVDNEGQKLPTPPRLQDANGSTAKSFHEMREFCADLEKRCGRDGILRSAGRTIAAMRLEAACCLFSCLREMRDMMSDSSLTLEEKRERISALHTKATDGILTVREHTDEQLGKLDLPPHGWTQSYDRRRSFR